MHVRTTPFGQETRCAIYTRRSLEQYADQFSSIESQRAICASYISSQRPNGWVELPKHYDDEGWTGGNLVRPALQDMLSDIESGLVDTVVIYKLDRITRSLLDFVRLMDLFQEYGVSFVAVTQNFDTGDSTGRLILNVLLTFAQFEREIASDRLKDKFAVMRERGMFVGGHPPYGYDLVDKKLVINPAEAKVVRWMFRRYLEVKSYTKVAQELKEKGVVRRSRVSKRGHLVVGRGICGSSVWNMLDNQLYVGRAQGKGHEYEGLHEGIVAKKLWDDVQALRAKRTKAKVVQLHHSDLLRGLMYDSYGRLMGVYRDYRYRTVRRYYISNQSEWGRRHGVRRFRTKADALEELVLAALTSLLVDRERLRSMLLRVGIEYGGLNKLTAAGATAAARLEKTRPRQTQCALKALLERIELSSTSIKLIVRATEVPRFIDWDGVGFFRGDKDAWVRPHATELIDVPTNSISMKRELTLLLKRPAVDPANKPNPRLVKMLKRARMAQAILDERSVTNVTDLARRMNCCPKRYTNLVRLNYLAPDIIASILDGTQPAHLTGTMLRTTDLPMDWALQRRLLGFPDQPDYLRAAPGW